MHFFVSNMQHVLSKFAAAAASTGTQAVDIMVALTGSEDVPVKKLLLWLEMARQELPDPAGKITLQAWTKVLQNLSTGHGSSSGFSKSRFGNASSDYIAM